MMGINVIINKTAVLNALRTLANTDWILKKIICETMKTCHASSVKTTFMTSLF